jgi:nickel superoxide dismutase
MKTIKPKTFLTIMAITLTAVFTTVVYSHCQIPCGIYGDLARFDAINEHLQTIEKSMNKVKQLSTAEKPDNNQIVRWVNNKEEHAENISHEITYYFMAQRLKPLEKTDSGYNHYVKKLTQLHEMLVESMKCKQTTDIAHVEQLRKLLTEFRAEYFSEDKH